MNWFTFCGRLIIFLGIFSLAILAFIFYTNNKIRNLKWKNDNTESNMVLIPESEIFDILIIGISHARNFSRSVHHQYLVEQSHCKILNLGQGGNLGGLSNQLLYLEYFFEKKNKTQNVWLVLSPSLMFNAQYDQASNAYEMEVLEWQFLRKLWKIKNDFTHIQLFRYFISKFETRWLHHKPLPAEPIEMALIEQDHKAVNLGLKQSYPLGLKDSIFEERAVMLVKMLQVFKTNNVRIHVLIPPALFGQWPGHKQVWDWLEKNKSLWDLKLYDFSESIQEAAYYYDHHHLNTKGMIHFYDQFIFPQLGACNGFRLN